ncbi:MAG: 50S ribosomal protein L11 [Spirochaetales bacterium]|jgi:large subunit ribosomal protein L11|nr:50S ribosomal protein L11 [Spirochaetales bacterium]
MAKKKVVAKVKIQIPAGKATPAPPVGPALGPHGVSAPQFVQQFNERTGKLEPGLTVPVVITIYGDKTFSFEVKSPPAAVLIKRACSLEHGSAEPHKVKVGKISQGQLREIAQTKLADLSANTLEAAVKIIGGTARSMGVEVGE